MCDLPNPTRVRPPIDLLLAIWSFLDLGTLVAPKSDEGGWPPGALRWRYSRRKRRQMCHRRLVALLQESPPSTQGCNALR